MEGIISAWGRILTGYTPAMSIEFVVDIVASVQLGERERSAVDREDRAGDELPSRK